MQTTVIPRYFKENNQLRELDRDSVCGAEFRIDRDVTRYDIIATSHLLAFILKGEKIIHCDGEDISVKKGEFVFIPKGRYMFSDIRCEDAEFRRLVLFFEDSFIQEFLRELPHSETQAELTSPLFTQKISPQLEQTIFSLQPYLNENLSYGETLMKNKLYEILFNILEQESSNQFLTLLKSIVNSPKHDLREFMSLNYREPLSVTEFAQLSCRSSRQFTRDFREVFNDTPSNWIREQRLEYAHHLLQSSTQSVTEISYESGFRNYSNFIQLFRKKYAITPKQLKAHN